MAFIPAPGSAKVEVRFNQDSQLVENVFHCLVLDPLDSAQATSIFNTVDAWVKATLRPRQTNNVAYREVQVTGLAAQDSPRFIFSGDGLVGTKGSSPMPNQTSIALKAGTGFGGRSARGRVFHIGIDRVVVVGNLLTSAESTALISTYNALMTSMTTAGHALHVLSYYHNQAPRTTAVQYPITGYSMVDLIVDSQRRRGPGRGK